MQKKYCFVLLAILISLSPAAVFAQTITVYDGDVIGQDTDWWTNTSTVQGNWDSTIDWGAYPPGDDKYFESILQVFIGADWNDVETVQVPDPPTPTIPPNQVTHSGLFPPLADGSYRLLVTAYHENITTRTFITSDLSDGFQIDTTAPTASVDPLPAVQTANTFTVSWTGSDAIAGIDSYDVQYRAGNGVWTTWLTDTSQESASFSGNNGETYSFRVRARDQVGNLSNYSAAAGPTVVNALSPALSVSSSPTSLSFAAAEDAHSLDLNILATGGTVTLTSIREDRNYPSWGAVEGIPASVNLIIPSGSTASLSRLVSLSSLDRAKALGSNTNGSFTLSYLISGLDQQGDPVQGTINLQAAVTGGLPSGLSVSSVSVQLPASPYYAGDVVQNPSVLIQASGSGLATGYILIDGSLSWSSTPSFTVTVNGDTSFTISGQVPTTVPGDHDITVVLTTPTSLSSISTYTVTAQTPIFPPQTLTLVPDVAELSDLNGSAIVVNGSGYEQFTFTGTATLRLLSLDNATLPMTSVNGLVIRYEDSAPGIAQIRGGQVEKTASGQEILATAADNTLKIKRIFFQGQVNPASDSLAIDAMLDLPALGAGELFALEGLTVRSGGIDPQSLSLSPSDGKTFAAFGLTFNIHNVAATPALQFAADAAHGYAFTLAGGLSLQERDGTTVTRDLSEFTNLVFYTDGEVSGSLDFTNPYTIIPGMLVFTGAEIYLNTGNLALNFEGEVSNLPEPFDAFQVTPFVLGLDPAGNALQQAQAVNELQSGHAVDGDASEWDYALATVDITYVGLDLVFAAGVFDKGQSSLHLGADFYINCSLAGGNSPPQDDDRRISYGELGSDGTLTGGVELDMDGIPFWETPNFPADFETAFGDKTISASSLTVRLDNLFPVTDPFVFYCSGAITLVDLPGINGEVTFDEMHLQLDGSTYLPDHATTQGDLSLMEIITVSVDEVDWSEEPTTLSFNRDTTLDDGENRTFQADTETLQVDSYFRLLGATINLIVSAAPFAGEFDELTVYKQGGNQNFVLKEAHVAMSQVDLKADVEYVDQVLRFSGELKLPGPGQEIKAIAVGKAGLENGQPTMGLFVAASNLAMAVAPGVYLDEIGGGLFVNPIARDIEDVTRMARFERPDMGLDDKIMEKKPAGAGNPGSFALMFVGGFYVSSKNTLKGRALFVITENYISLDAEAEAMKGVIEAYAFMEIGWNPGYAEGYFVIDLNLLKIIKGNGNLGFYAYDSETWGVFGGFDIEFFGMELASASMFVGPPGFMLETAVHIGIDIVIVSGSIDFEAMFWYNRAADPDTWGAYAAVEVKGSLLAGLLAASAKLEGALIGGVDVLIYAVGSVKFEVCWITVFEGSLWVSIGTNGLDGGTGRNSEYDQLIEDARNMADQMAALQEDLLDALQQAKLELARMSEEQLEAAGLTLIERSGWGGALVQMGFTFSELDYWEPQGLPPELNSIREMMFGSGQETIVQRRSELEQRINQIEDDLADLNDLQTDVAARLGAYEGILLEELPDISELGSLENPLTYQLDTLTVGGVSSTQIVAFEVDESLAQSQADRLAAQRESFAAYQESFIEQAGMLDARLQQIDEILFQGAANLTVLNRSYARQYLQTTQYLADYLEFQDSSKVNAEIMIGLMDLITDEEDVNELLLTKAAQVNASTLNNWIDDRILLMHALVSTGMEGGSYEAQTEPNNPEYQIALFAITGLDLWWNAPRQGFNAVVANAPLNKNHALDTFQQNAGLFRQKWITASQITDAYFERKATLYDILYEIYDQLATYGSGLIGITGEGNAAGFGGTAGTGLAFRSSAVAQTLSVEGSFLPTDAIPRGAPTVGPLRPMLPGSNPPGVFEEQPGGFGKPRSKQRSELRPGTPIARALGSAEPASGLLSGLPLLVLGAETPGASTPGGSSPGGMAGVQNFTGLPGQLSLDLSLDSQTENLPSYGGLDRDIFKSAESSEPVSWIGVRRYFAAKRAETTPFVEIPTIDSLTGGTSSDTEDSAYLSADFTASHPVGVVEYSYKIEPAAAESVARALSPYDLFLLDLPAIADANLAVPNSMISSGTFSSGSAQAINSHMQTLAPLSQQTASLFEEQGLLFSELILSAIFRPWFSLGLQQQILEPFFAGLSQEGSYYLTLRARGAGGKTIIRRGTFSLEYFDADTDSGPIGSSLDASDRTAPAAPVVNLTSLFSSSEDLLYAQWQAQDPESGIQEYSYAVGSYPSPGGERPGEGQTIAKEDPKSPRGSLQPALPTVATDILDWTSAGGRTEANIRGLPLQHGQQYVVSVKVTNGVGLQSIGSSDPVLIDTTAPDSPVITTLQQVNSDGHPNSVYFVTSEPEDPESGIAIRRFALGSAEGMDDVFAWTDLSGASATVVDLKVLNGQTLYLTVEAVNGAGLESSGGDSVVINFSDASPPPGTSVTTDPQPFLGDDVLTLRWAAVADGESGVVGYEYGLGSSPGTADIRSWNPLSPPDSAYVLGQGSPPAAQPEDLSAEITELALLTGQQFYAVVRTINGAGLSSVASSPALIFDSSPPTDGDLNGPQQWSDRNSLSVQLGAVDSESGIAAYRFALWEGGSLSEAEAPVQFVPVSGLTTSGSFQGTFAITGQVVAPQQSQPPQGSTPSGGTPGQVYNDPLQSQQDQIEAPPWSLLDLQEQPPFYESLWIPVSNGAPPEQIDLQIDISGFPKLKLNRLYQLRMWVKNGAGVVAEAGSIYIQIVRPPRGKAGSRGRGGTSEGGSL